MDGAWSFAKRKNDQDRNGWEGEIFTLNIPDLEKLSYHISFDYEYGNKFNINTTAYYKFSIKNKLSVAPNMSVQFETAQEDLDKGLPVEVSGGNLLVGTVGVETSVKRIAIGAKFQTPLSQDLGKGIIKANNRCMVHVSLAWWIYLLRIFCKQLAQRIFGGNSLRFREAAAGKYNFFFSFFICAYIEPTELPMNDQQLFFIT